MKRSVSQGVLLFYLKALLRSIVLCHARPITWKSVESGSETISEQTLAILSLVRRLCP